MKSKLLIGAMLAAFVLLVTGCQEKGPAEKAGEKIDNAVGNMQDNGNDVLDKASDAIEEAGDKIESKTD